MRAIAYAQAGDPSVLELVERVIPEPGQGELRIRVAVSGVNPTDWKARTGSYGREIDEPTVPNQDGAGVVDEVGAGVAGFSVGDRVWVTLAGDGRPASGTAQEHTVVPAGRVFPLPDAADCELGASGGIPAVTAHRALTVAEDGPARLEPGALSAHVVLVAAGRVRSGTPRSSSAAGQAQPSSPPSAGRRRRGLRSLPGPTMSSTTRSRRPSPASAISRPAASTSSSRSPRARTPTSTWPSSARAERSPSTRMTVAHPSRWTCGATWD